MTTKNKTKCIKGTVKLDKKRSIITVIGSDYKCCISLSDGNALLMKSDDGSRLVEFPLDVASKRMDGQVVHMKLPLRYESKDYGFDLISSSGLERFNVRFSGRWIEFAYAANSEKNKSFRPSETLYFLRHSNGMKLKESIEGFDACPKSQFFAESEEAYRTIFPTCNLNRSQFTPPPQVLSVRMPSGWFSMGLNRLPDSNLFKITLDRGLLVDQPGGNLQFKGTQEYAPPGVIFMFPKSEWHSLSLYREILIERGIVEDIPIENKLLPEWWKYPIYVTYGDQIMELQRNEFQTIDWSHNEYNSNWLRKSIKYVENKINQPFNVIIDAYWTDPGNFDPKPSERFRDLKKLIHWCHQRRHKVLLWCTPLATNVSGGNGKLVKKHKMFKPKSQIKCNIDYTSPNTHAFLKELCENYFSHKGLDADGLKMDFLANIADPKETKYQAPQKGMGCRELYELCRTFSDIARKIKKDVCINFSAADVRFNDVISMNRLHDVHASLEERLRRARISATAMPNTIIDSDGAFMYSFWLERHYLHAALYGICSLYYSRKLQDGVQISDEQWKILNALFTISVEKPWGHPVCHSYGNWQLVSNGRPVGQTCDNELIMVYTDPKKAKLLSLESKQKRVSTLGRKIKSVSPKPADLKISKNAIIATWQRGQMYTLRAE